MAEKYKFVRMPVSTYKLYQSIQMKMTGDVRLITGKNIKLPMTKVFKAVVSPEFNENFIQVDLNKLSRYAQKKHEK